MENIIWVVLLCAVLALLFAAWKTSAVSKADAGTERMKEIAGNISDGARAFLFAEYKILVIFVAVLFVLIGLFITWLTAGCFLIGAVFSVCAGYVGMNVATKANVRTAAAAKSSGMNKALGVAFSGGSVMGMCVVGLGLLGCAAIYAFTGNVEILTGFSLGASSIALFARVGGGIYTKAADVGADLVGKVEAGIPEDDPRNPAVIADNVGDNVGDVAGMGADLFESYVGALVSALTLGVAVVGTFNGAGALFPLILAAAGIVASIIGCFFVRGDENSNPHKALKMGSYVSSAIVVVLSLVLSNVFFGGMAQAISIVKHFGRIDVLINAAGIPGPSARVEDYSFSDAKKVLSVNLFGTFLMMHTVLPVMQAQKHGAILNFGSVSGVVGYPFESAYGASKAAIIHLTKNAASENGGNGVRINAISPGWVKTNMMATILDSYKNVGFDNADENVTLGPMGRPGTPEEIANVAAFLCSEEASYANGSNFLVDGGMTLG